MPTVLRQGRVLIASVQEELSDSQWETLRRELLERAGNVRTFGAVIDVGGMEIVDSYAGRTLRSMAQMLKLRGVDTVVVGIQPAVALAMVQLGLALDDVETALDLDDGLALLNRRLEHPDG